MSRIASQPAEDVDLDDRSSMTPARKHRIWLSRDGICWMCNFPVPEVGPEVRYDHKVPLELGGSDDDVNLYPLHREPCDRIKTAADRKRIDKMRRQRGKLHKDAERTKSPSWRGGSRPFSQPIRIPTRKDR